MPHQGVCTSQTGSRRLYKHRVNNQAESAAKHKNVLVITDHFTRYSMAFVTKDQKAKTTMQILYEWFISVFGAPTKLLSDRGVNSTSALVEELCSVFGIQKCRITAYHVQCNGQVE